MLDVDVATGAGIGGLPAGFPHAFVLTGQLQGEEHAWRMALFAGVGLLIVGARNAVQNASD